MLIFIFPIYRPRMLFIEFTATSDSVTMDPITFCKVLCCWPSTPGKNPSGTWSENTGNINRDSKLTGIQPQIGVLQEACATVLQFMNHSILDSGEVLHWYYVLIVGCRSDIRRSSTMSMMKINTCFYGRILCSPCSLLILVAEDALILAAWSATRISWICVQFEASLALPTGNATESA